MFTVSQTIAIEINPRDGACDRLGVKGIARDLGLVERAAIGVEGGVDRASFSVESAQPIEIDLVGRVTAKLRVERREGLPDRGRHRKVALGLIKHGKVGDQIGL